MTVEASAVGTTAAVDARAHDGLRRTPIRWDTRTYEENAGKLRSALDRSCGGGMDFANDFSSRCGELVAISAEYAYTLASLQGGFIDLPGVPGQLSKALVLRPSRAPGPIAGGGRPRVRGADTRG